MRVEGEAAFVLCFFFFLVLIVEVGLRSIFSWERIAWEGTKWVSHRGINDRTSTTLWLTVLLKNEDCFLRMFGSHPVYLHY